MNYFTLNVYADRCLNDLSIKFHGKDITCRLRKEGNVASPCECVCGCVHFGSEN